MEQQLKPREAADCRLISIKVEYPPDYSELSKEGQKIFKKTSSGIDYRHLEKERAYPSDVVERTAEMREKRIISNRESTPSANKEASLVHFRTSNFYFFLSAVIARWVSCLIGRFGLTCLRTKFCICEENNKLNKEAEGKFIILRFNFW